MSMALITLSEFLREYDVALEWLLRRRVRIDGTRLATYRRVIAGAEQEEVLGRFDHQQRAELLNALVEASEIIDLSQIDEEHLVVPDVPDKLLRISGGPAAMAPEGADPARDYAFEFHTAAVLQGQEDFGGFSLHGGDLTVGVERYPVECKRVSSLNSLRGRLRDGRDKLERLVGDGSLPGIIAVDLTRPIRMAQGQIVAVSDEQFVHEADQRLTAYLASHVMTARNIETVARPSVLGVIVRCLSAGFAGEHGNVRRSIVWQACSIHADGSPEDELFRRIARAFGPGELLEGTFEEIVAATAQIEVTRG